MVKRIGMNGDTAVAYAVKQADVDVIAAYPITPQTIIVEKLSEYVNNGELNAAYVPVESEHSALSACVGASLAGARVFTATASQGLALMYEILYIASSLRTTIVMALGNRALSAPINIHCSHDDAYAARDAGWIQLFAENVQEAYDLTLQAFRISEDKNVLLPTIVNLDGFILTHSLEGVNVFEDEDIAKFLPPKEPIQPIDPENPITYGPLGLFDSYIEFKKQQAEAMKASYPHILQAFKEFEEFSGRSYKPIKTLGMEDAEIAIMVLGSTAGTVREVVRKMREKGEKVGTISLTLYRPFPEEELKKVLKGVKVLAVMDRSYSFGSPGAQLFMDVTATLINMKEKPLIFNVIYGLGGRDLVPNHVLSIIEKAKEYAELGEVSEKEIWIGVRE
ncbi:MAG: pyruvate ferredoxin oxidoreductase [Thermofilum sp. ex4484_82]|nr:MAG: pyruvate ferredoxin oxidoreductase [Thermofilum sp. ex4484_82]OYT36144.1 MAG: pyruvate ferredoxin oxidoreductase [Archaeoglobales archaeon ex4484_92]RLE77029.1 MAG: pyruvate ferredoxin oxidoreductase [Thermoprotei archaeon]